MEPSPDGLAAPPKPRVWTLFVGFFGVMLATGVVQLVVLVALSRLHSGPVPLRELGLEIGRALLRQSVWVAMLLVSSGVLAVAAFALARPRPFVARLALGPGRHPVRYAVFGAVGALAAAELTTLVVQGFGVHNSDRTSELAHRLFRTLAQGERPTFLGLLIAGSVFAPVSEELFFRGYLQTRFAERWGAKAGVLVTALLFGLLHMNVAQSVSALVIGSVLGWTAVRSGSVWPGVVAHALNNLLVFMMLRWSGAAADQAPTFSWLITGAVCATVLLAVFRLEAWLRGRDAEAESRLLVAATPVIDADLR